MKICALRKINKQQEKSKRGFQLTCCLCKALFCNFFCCCCWCPVIIQIPNFMADTLPITQWVCDRGKCALLSIQIIVYLPVFKKKKYNTERDANDFKKYIFGGAFYSFFPSIHPQRRRRRILHSSPSMWDVSWLGMLK